MNTNRRGVLILFLAFSVNVPFAVADQGAPTLEYVGPDLMQLTVQVEPPGFAPIPSMAPVVMPMNQGCCSATCNGIDQSGCAEGVTPCCFLPGAVDPCSEGSSGNPNVCGCYSHCSLTCAVGGRTCYDLCYFGPSAPVPVCDGLCNAIVQSMASLCEAAKEAGSSSFTYEGVTVGCAPGKKIIGCAPIHVPCAPLACVDCLFCSAIGLCGAQVECGDNNTTPTPTPTPTTTPTSTANPTQTPTPTPTTGPVPPEGSIVYLR
jgi:hypothetical protein